MLALFFEKTWLFWWMVALVVIVRWFHVVSAGNAGEYLAPPPVRGEHRNGKALPTQCPAGMRTLR